MCLCFSSVLHFLPASSQQVKGMKRKKRKESYATAGQKSVDFLFVFMGIFRPAASTINNKQDKNCYSTYKIQKRGPQQQHSTPTATHVSQKIDREVIKNKDANEGHLVAASRRAIKPMVGSSSTHFPLHTSPVLSFQLSD